MPRFDLEGARREGYSDQEIGDFLRQQNPKFDFEGATQEGYSLEEITEFLGQQPQRGALSQAGRSATQLALGAAQATPIGLAYEAATFPAQFQSMNIGQHREILQDELERLTEQKATGVWDAQDEELLQKTIEMIRNPEAALEFVQAKDIGLQAIAENLSGVDLNPEGALEKGARWAGWIRSPRKWADLARNGMTKTQFLKNVLPTGGEALRGLAAGAALQAAEEGEMGPIGSLAVAIAADVAAGGAVSGAKKAAEFVRNPKQMLAKGAAALPNAEKRAIQQQIIKDFREAGIQADLGTITNSNLIRNLQTRLGQSSLTGEGLQNLRKQMSEEILNEYKTLANGLGEYKHTTQFEAGEAAKGMIERIRATDLDQTRAIYEASEKALSKDAKVFTDRLLGEVEKLKSKLEPGSVKSTQQKAVLDALEKIEADLKKAHPERRAGFVNDLINNKIALNDIIDYEVQGGAKQLLKGIVKELDRAIISHGSVNPTFAKNYIAANKRFSQHAKTFRNKNISAILKAQDPTQAIRKMNTVQGIKDIEKALSGFQEGRQLFGELKRYKLEEMIGQHMVDGATEQLKFGKFSGLTDKKNNREILSELLGKKDFKRLQSIQKNAGVLAESANRFLNTSQTATTAADAAIMIKGVNAFMGALHGNFWPLLKTGAGILGARRVANLLADPQFLTLVEDAILAGKSKNVAEINRTMQALRPYLVPLVEEVKDETAPQAA